MCVCLDDVRECVDGRIVLVKQTRAHTHCINLSNGILNDSNKQEQQQNVCACMTVCERAQASSIKHGMGAGTVCLRPSEPETKIQ